MKKINFKRKVLVFAPHPDDETLGCSGFLQSLRKNGSHLKLAFYLQKLVKK